MRFLLQEEINKTGDRQMDPDIRIVQDVLARNPYIHSYCCCSLEELAGRTGDADCIPVGTLEFVQAWLQKYHGISRMEPIELPVCLQLPDFLKREYTFVRGCDLPKTGRFFIKRADVLKELSFSGEIACLWQSGLIREEGIYQLTEIVDFLSEWRIYIRNWRTEQCANYDGDPLIFPDRDVIRQAIHELMRDYRNHYPQSFTLDVGILPDGSTVLIEMHPWCCVGLYSTVFGNSLPYCYADGIAWYVKENTPELYLK